MKSLKISILSTFVIILFSSNALSWTNWSNSGIGNSLSRGSIFDIEVITNQDGRLGIFAIHQEDKTSNVRLWYKTQKEPNDKRWTNWFCLGRPSGVDLTAWEFARGGIIRAYHREISAVLNERGEIMVFVKCSDGRIYYIQQRGNQQTDTHISGWYGWQSVNAEDDQMAPAFSSNIGAYHWNNGIILSVIDDAGDFWFKIYNSSTGWSGWSNCSSPDSYHLTGKPLVGERIDDSAYGYTYRFYGVGENGELWEGSIFMPWQTLGRPQNGIRTYLDPMIGRNKDGRLEIFVIDSFGEFWKRYQLKSNLSWSNWVPLPQRPTNSEIVKPEIVVNKDGRMEIFYLDSYREIYHTYQVVPNGRWSGYWEDLGSPGNHEVGSITSDCQANGILFIFADLMGGNNYPYYRHW